MTHTRQTREDLHTAVYGVPHLIGQPTMVYDGSDVARPTELEDIYVLDPGTGRLKRLTGGGSGPDVSDVSPAWSPDHKQIAFSRCDGSTTHLVIIHADTGATVAEFLGVPGSGPVWMDARHLVYTAEYPDAAHNNLCILDVTSGQRVRLTALAPGEWLGDADWHETAGLAATLLRDGNAAEIVTIPAAVVHDALLPRFQPLISRRLTRVSVSRRLIGCSQPAWSPDGTRIAFRTTNWSINVIMPGMTGPGAKSEIALIDLSGTGYLRVTSDPDAVELAHGTDSSPIFSPDGAFLAWLRGHDEDAYQIVVTETADLGRHLFVPGLARWTVINRPMPHHMRKSLDW